MKSVKRILILIFCFCQYPVLLMAETTSKVENLDKVEPFSLINMFNTVIGLVAVIGLILALAWAVKKYGRLPTNSQADMKVLGGLSLGTREKAVLIEVEGKKLLLGIAPGRVETLYVLGDSDQSSNEFNKTLNHAIGANQ